MAEQMTVSRAGEFSYEIIWNNDFTGLACGIKDLNLKGRKACIVTDSVVAPLYLEKVKEEISSLFDVVSVFIFPTGEENKTLDTVKQLYTHLIQNRFERKDILLALGGGVVGDLTGFTAATYLRGIDFIQIPTTLLSQVDSSIGGKTGVDFDQFKNMVGAFHQPRLVYMSMETLSSLPSHQFSSGMGEVLKSGLIRDKEYYNWLLEEKAAILNRDPEALISMIKGSCNIKKIVVEHDPMEMGERAILNLGHTLGHAVEKLMNFKMLHGQCVGLGTIAASFLSYKRGMISKEELDLIHRGNTIYGLPETISDLSPDDIIQASKSDKKMEQGRIKFILLDGIGNAVIDLNVSEEDLKSSLEYIIR